jgi:hypothetical protein
MPQPDQSLRFLPLQGGPRWLLRLEGAALMLAGIAFYAHLSMGWLLFLVLFLVPDLSMLGYVAGPRAGAAIYNCFHSTLLPFALLAAGALTASSPTIGGAAIWLAHIGFDRLLGYGLKYAAGFSETHLGRIGGTP